MVDRRLEQHDSNQLELKLSYVVEPGAKRQEYQLESYMFIQRTLGVSSQSYGADRFFEDTSTFVRLKTPGVALEALAKPGRSERWFEPVRAGLDATLGGDAGATAPMVRGLKLLGCIYRSAIRDEARLIAGRFATVTAGERDVTALRLREEQVASTLGRFVDELTEAVARLREACARCERPVVPEVVRETWAAVDEYVAISAEEAVTNLVSECDTHLARVDGRESPMRAIRDRLAGIAVAEYHYRRSRGYPSWAVPGDANEDLPRRRRILKRIVSSVLYLDVSHEEGGTLQRDAIAAVAAAVAMAFAIFVSLWAQVNWGLLSSTFVIIAVISYMVKDRIKDWGKRYLGRRLARWLPDYVVRVRDPNTGKVIGQVRESVGVLDPARIDPAVHDLRHADHPSAIAEHGRPEVVIRYVKEVALDSADLHAAMPGVEGLNDIIRFNFSHFRQRMDDAVETYRVVHPTTRELIDVPCHRVYHVNFVLRISRGARRARTTVTERVRVILDQQGIVRVESVDPTHDDGRDRITGTAVPLAHRAVPLPRGAGAMAGDERLPGRAAVMQRRR